MSQIDRRQTLAWLAASALPSVAAAQPASAAAEEAKAPPLPAVGSRLVVPRIERLDG